MLIYSKPITKEETIKQLKELKHEAMLNMKGAPFKEDKETFKKDFAALTYAIKVLTREITIEGKEIKKQQKK